MTPEAAQSFPEELRDQLGPELPDVLLSYQQEVLATTSHSALTAVEKSRRIGVTWAIAADAVLTSATARSAGGMDSLYIGYNLDMAREFIDTCAMWAKAFNYVAGEVEEFVFKDRDKEGDRNIQAFRISFASGFEIVALTSKPRSLRGRQGYVIIDEAAFHDDLDELLKAAIALLMWGGKVLVISTHDGEVNPFNGLINDIRAGRRKGEVVRITFDDAIADGLYERVAMMLKARKQPVPSKQEWISDIRGFYGEDAKEELDVIPAQGTGTALSGALIEMRMVPDIPVLRFECADDFKYLPEHVREAEVRDFLESELKHRLAGLPMLPSVFGEDFGRVRDLTVIWPAQILQNLVRRPPFVIELWNMPFDQQKQALFYIVDRLPRFMAGALDATGNGAYLAEAAALRYGHDRIEEVKFSVEWYRENMPKFVAAFEDGTVVLPRDADVLGDHRGLRKVNGVIQVPALRAQDTKDRNKKRHCDSAIAHALAYYASVMDVREYAYTPAPAARRPGDEPSSYDEDDHPARSGMGGIRGAW